MTMKERGISWKRVLPSLLQEYEFATCVSCKHSTLSSSKKKKEVDCIYRDSMNNLFVLFFVEKHQLSMMLQYT